MFERFTDRARKVMALANQEAQRLNHEYIGTEHLLLGIVKEGSGVGANVLRNMDVDLKNVRIEVEKLVKPSPDMITMGKLPQTPRTKKAIELAIASARSLNHNYVGTEHLLLGLLREGEGVAAQVLLNLGLDTKKTEEEVLNLLGVGVEEFNPEIHVTAPCNNPKIISLEKEIQELNKQKDDFVRNAEYDNASNTRDLAEQKRQELEELKKHCNKCSCGATAQVYTQEQNGNFETKDYFCEKCAINKANREANSQDYTDASKLTPQQLTSISLTYDESPIEQTLLKTLMNVETGLFEVLNLLTSPDFMSEVDALDVVIEAANFIKNFTAFRDKLLS